MNKVNKIKLRIDKDTIYLDVSHDGKRERFSTKLRITGDQAKDDYNLKIADEIRKKKELELLENKTGFRLTDQKRSKTELTEYTQKKMKDRSSPKLYHYSILRFTRFYSKSIAYIEDITEKHMKDFLKFLEGENISLITIKNYMNHLRIIFNLAIDDRIIAYNPAKNVRPAYREVIKVYLTIEEVKRLYHTPADRDEIKNAFIFACFTGLRISDLKKLRWDSVKNDKLVIVQQKTSNIVSMALSKTAKDILTHQRDQFFKDAYVFHLLEKNRTRKHLKKWIQDSGITKNVSFHTARHTFATMCLTSGIDIFTTSKLLGHSDVKTTQIYAKLIDRKKDEAIELMPEK
jgi:integrase